MRQKHDNKFRMIISSWNHDTQLPKVPKTYTVDLLKQVNENLMENLDPTLVYSESVPRIIVLHTQLSITNQQILW